MWRPPPPLPSIPQTFPPAGDVAEAGGVVAVVADERAPAEFAGAGFVAVVADDAVAGFVAAERGWPWIFCCSSMRMKRGEKWAARGVVVVVVGVAVAAGSGFVVAEEPAAVAAAEWPAVNRARS